MNNPIIETSIDIDNLNLHFEDGKVCENLDVFVLQEKMIFPDMPIPVPLEETSKSADIESIISKGGQIFVTTLRPGQDASKLNMNTVYRTGVIVTPLRVANLPDGQCIVLSYANCRGKLKSMHNVKGKLSGNVTVWLDNRLTMTDPVVNMEFQELCEMYDKLTEGLSESDRNEIKFALKSLDEFPEKKISFMISNSPLEIEDRYELLRSKTMEQRLEMLLEKFSVEIEKMAIRRHIQQRTHEMLSEQQKEMFMNQQIRALQEELGIEEDMSDSYELKKRLDEKTDWDEDLRNYFLKELHRMERFNPNSPDYANQYCYLDTLLSLPWHQETESKISIKEVREQLDKDHFGLEKVKERILEHVAVLKLRDDMKAPILCLYGPPGVGKTSLGKSVAKAMNRNYSRLSLGGLHDEAEIRGHRRTYIGAMPGRIISAMLKAGSSNPVIVLDEIDKIGNDYKGDPSQALLEVLDPEQNSKFHDNYVDYDYDLSKVFFIATANDLSTISRPLLDRMEIIEIPGYAAEEKTEIAFRHIVPKVLEDLGMKDISIRFEREAIEYIISNYTRESGVRQLEKQINAVMRKLAVKKAEDEILPEVITPALVREFLGRETVFPDSYENNEYAGVVTGLAWTSAGGDILFIESSLSEGKGEKLTLTGNLGDVMKESAVIALQWLRANGQPYGITSEMLSKHDVHIHVPEGAVPKDGPSAGITMVTSLASAFTHRKVRSHLAMTGEISLRGKVLPVGGIKEKMLAARRAGIKTIVLCEKNRKDVEEINPEYIKDLEFHYVDRIEDVLDFALLEDKV